MAGRRAFRYQVCIGQVWRETNTGRRFGIINVWRKDERAHIIWLDTGQTEEKALFWMKHYAENTVLYV